jgi:aminopeptidase
MTFEEKLQNYAKLMVCHGLNVQPGQMVNISAEAYHRELAMMAVEEAWKRGASYVNLDLNDARTTRLRVQHSEDKDLEFVPAYVSEKYKEIVDKTGANLAIRGSEYPDILADLPTKKVNNLRLSNHKAIKYFYDEGIVKSKVHWSLANGATPGWASKIFPEMEPEEACKRLWGEIFKACRADKENCLELWKEHNDRLHARSKRLNDLELETIHFSGPGTDLKVGLSKLALFKGGGDESPRGVEYEPNIPTEEVFTTPDNRKTEGEVSATRPFLINGVLIENLKIVFEEGKIADFSATNGAETFKEYTSSDPGASRLGEVALVGTDSPIFQSGLVFQDILYDENAACHIAVGSAYKFCLKGGESLSKEKLEEIGCNESMVHTDMMISSEEVSVKGTAYSGKEVQLIENGKWVE